MRSRSAVLSLLAAGALVVGAWALLAPTSFYSDFPGFLRGWVALDGPYNEHLIRDVGALQLALALLSAVAAARAVPVLTRTAATAWLVWAVPHLAYHAAHLAPFAPLDAVLNVTVLSAQVIAPLYVLLSLRNVDSAPS